MSDVLARICEVKREHVAARYAAARLVADIDALYGQLLRQRLR